MYKRVLLKLSGESLGGPAGKGLDTESLRKMAREVAAAAKAGLQVAIVNGGETLSGKDKWIINIQSAVRSSRNKVDFHFIYDNRDRNKPSVEKVADVEKLLAAVNEAFSKAPFDDEPHIAEQSALYRLSKNNIAYKLREKSEGTNIFHIRVASSLINMDLRRSVAMYILADRIRQAFAPQQEMREVDKQELQSKGYGYNL